MADFCWQCTEELGLATGPENDFYELGPEVLGRKKRVLCEGCGWTYVDTKGRCLGPVPRPRAEGEASDAEP